MNKFLAFCTAMLLTVMSAVSMSAQNGYEVKGVVIDNVGPVIGATVVEKGTTNGTATGLDGDFILKVSGPDALVEISCMGYSTVTFTASQLPSKITIEEDKLFLEDAVVIGYGTVKKEDMTGSVVAIKAEELNRGAVVNTQEMLKGKIPGLLVTPGDGGPGSGSRIRIRGGASLNASNDPLIVIDGVPIACGAGSGMSNPLETLNPNDIESFSVLKDASSAAIYGSRATNGVIIITTKKGTGSKPQVSYNGSVSLQQNSRTLPVMTAAELRDFYNEYYPAGTPDGDKVQALLGEHNVDYNKEIFRLAVSTDHNVSLYGNVKGNRMPYRASIGYTRQEGTLRGSDYDRGTFDLNLSPNFLDEHLKLDFTGKGVYTHQNYVDGGVVGNAGFFNPTIDPYFRNEDGSIDYTTANGYWNYGTGRGEEFMPNTLVGASPLSQLNDKISNGQSMRFIGRAAIDYKVHGLEALRFNVSGGIDMTKSNNFNKVKPGSFAAYCDTEARGQGQFHKGYNLNRSSVLEAYADYNETWGKHNLDVMAGYSWHHNYWENQSISYFNETGEVKLKPEEEMSTRYPVWRNENYLVSFYGRINYSIDSRYIFTVSVRGDGSSKFAKANRWGVFPSGAFAWNIKNESFLKNSRVVSDLKLRLSAGVTGQQDGIGDYVHLARYAMSNDPYHTYDMGDAGYMPFLTPSAYDPTIKWETTTTYNVGIDFGFWDGRFTGNVDAYLRDTKDLLNNVLTPMGSNFGNSVMTNVGSIRNKGIEFALNGIPVQTEDWSLQIGFNGTFQDTKFTKLNNTDDENYMIQVGGISRGTGSKLSVHKVGYAPYTFMPYQQLYDAEGHAIQNAFVDRDNDGLITEADRYMSKSPAPKFFYGLNLKLSYKNWDFGFNGHGSAGNWVFNDFASAHSTSFLDINAGNLPNQALTVKKTGFHAQSVAQQFYSDMFLENASFFRLDDINMGYTFSNIGRWGTDIRLALGVQNVFVITGYSGIDPEVVSVEGIDNAMWPRPRTYSLRLNINF